MLWVKDQQQDRNSALQLLTPGDVVSPCFLFHFAPREEIDLDLDMSQVGMLCNEEERELAVERMGLTPDWIIHVRFLTCPTISPITMHHGALLCQKCQAPHHHSPPCIHFMYR